MDFFSLFSSTAVTIILALLNKIDFNTAAASSLDSAIRRNLHILFQKADSNHDKYLDREELEKFVEVFTIRMAQVQTKAKLTADTVEGAKILARELLKKQTGNMLGRLSYRGTLLRKSDATNFGGLLEKLIVNLVYEVSGLQPPYSNINPFDS